VALGTTFGTVIGVDLAPSIVASAAVAIAYTVFGGLRAVAYTDVIQLFLILIGLGLAVPFAVEAAGGVGALGVAAQSEGSLWLSSPGEWLNYGDWLILFILGGIPWNVYFQRVLSSPDENTAAKTSMAAGVLCLFMAVPPLLLGLAGRSIDWTALDTGSLDAAAALAETPAMILPLTLRYAVPLWVSVVGLGAVSAAVMSSVDSSMLSAASLISWNGYHRLINPKATAEQVTRLVRILVVILGIFATVVALTVSSVAALWFLCGDIVYCVLFPQLTLALFDRRANRTGALAGFSMSVLLRLLSGDTTLGIPALLSWPVLTEGTEFPFRTVCMLAGLLTAFVVSRVTAKSDPPRPLRTLEDA
jgi:high affinity choline transporter 7